MNVLVVEPGMAPYEKEINGLKDMQAIVGGMITASYPFKEKVAIVSNDEGLLLKMEVMIPKKSTSIFLSVSYISWSVILEYALVSSTST